MKINLPYLYNNLMRNRASKALFFALCRSDVNDAEIMSEYGFSVDIPEDVLVVSTKKKQ